MGLLMSDSMAFDLMLDDASRLRDGLGAWACAVDATREAYEYEAADPTD